MLKHSLLALTLAGLIYAAPAVAQNDAQSGAQNSAPDQQSSPAGGHEWRGHGQMDPAKRTEMLTKKLSLTADQQTKVQDIFKSEQSQMQALRNDSSMSGDDRRTKMMDIHKTSSDQVRALLDATQQKKWDEMQSRREGRGGHRHGGQTPPSDSGQ
jgi:Spy/CpxP family protein refolding chaperone